MATLTTLVDFTGTNGSFPGSLQFADNAGDLLGATGIGGTSNFGTVYEIAAGTGTLTTLADNLSPEQQPEGPLVADAAGDLFGVTICYSAAYPNGTVFEIAAGTGATIALALFQDQTQYHPFGLIGNSAGDLFGTTSGVSGEPGTAFEIAPGTHAATTLAYFLPPLGTAPDSGLTADAAGDLFGATANGGPGGDGTVFEIAAGSGTVTTLAGFDGANGSTPTGLIEDRAGDLFGTTTGTFGTTNDGTVFEIAAGSGTVTTLANFDGANGAIPMAGLLADSAGDLFGTTKYGGTYNDGTVFEIAAGSGTVTALANFDGTDGRFPEAGLIADSAGDLFGTTAQGALNDNGTVFELTGTGFQGGGSGPFAPTISGTVAGQTTTDRTAATPFAHVSIWDGNGPQIQTATVTLSVPGNGTLSNLGHGTYDASTGVYTVSGSAATVTAALDGLVFAPAVGEVPPGEVATTSFAIADTDSAGASTADSTTTVTAIATESLVANEPNGTSFLEVLNPTVGTTKIVSQYSGPNLTGTRISEVVDRTDGTSIVYAFDPAAGATETASAYASADATGALISDVVDNSDGTSLVYAYDPTSAATLTVQKWSQTNIADGSPAGTLISDVVDNVDGTSLIYEYNPSSGVTLNVSRFLGTNPANGAPAGAETLDILDKADGTSIVYAYNPSSGVTQTASFYSSTDLATGAPAGTLTSETIDHTDGESSVSTFGANGGTQYYSGPDGTGVPIVPPATTTGTVSASSEGSPVGDTTTISASGQSIDLGPGNHAIQFLAGATSDTLVLHDGGIDSVMGFDPSAGDRVDLSALLAEANVDIGDAVSQLANYVWVANVDGSAAIMFDPTGRAGGSQVALLENDGGLVAQLQTAKAFAI